MKDKHSLNQAKAQLKSITQMVLNLYSKNEETAETAREEIQNDPLSVQVRSGWHNPGETGEPEEYEILLCTGGPAVCIVGRLNGHNEPESARIEHQDWGTPWTALKMDYNAEKTVLEYARQFYYSI